jgi:hypothetical protein
LSKQQHQSSAIWHKIHSSFSGSRIKIFRKGGSPVPWLCKQMFQVMLLLIGGWLLSCRLNHTGLLLNELSYSEWFETVQHAKLIHTSFASSYMYSCIQSDRACRWMRRYIYIMFICRHCIIWQAHSTLFILLRLMVTSASSCCYVTAASRRLFVDFHVIVLWPFDNEHQIALLPIPLWLMEMGEPCLKKK